jgi:hypothetical protein
VLNFDDFGYASMTESMLAMGDDWAFEVFDAHGTFLLALYDQLQSLLQESSVLVIQDHSSLLIEKFEQVLNPLPA